MSRGHGVLLAPFLLTTPTRAHRSYVGGPWWLITALVVGAGAFAARIVPLLHGGGLFGWGTYDEGVHYAAAVGLLHGRWLYSDVLFLQPPGIALLLTPFAALGQVTTEVTGIVVGRLVFMFCGAVTAVLVARYLRPLGLLPAFLGGIVYAVFPAVAYVERLLLLEGPQNLLLILTLLLVTRSARADVDPKIAKRLLLLAGVALGLSASIKIWTVAAALLIVIWVWVARRSWRAAARILIAALITGAVIALPFLIAARQTMIEMIVTDQLGRRRSGTDDNRWTNLTGLSQYAEYVRVGRYLPYAIAALVLMTLIAFTVYRTRLAAALLVVNAVVIVASPSDYLHYAALAAVPLALAAGGAAARLAVLAGGPRRWPVTIVIAGLIMTAALGYWAKPFARERTGIHFPRATLAPVAQRVGCVTADDPGMLAQLNVLGRDAARGCRYVIDLGGASYHPPLRTDTSRRKNRGWQPYALEYFRSGDLVIQTRFSTASGFTKATARTIASWPIVKQSGRFALRNPRVER